jgi:hypothetical protein
VPEESPVWRKAFAEKLLRNGMGQLGKHPSAKKRRRNDYSRRDGVSFLPLC